MKNTGLRNYWGLLGLIATCSISAAIVTGCSAGSGNDTSAGVGSGGTGVLAKSIIGTVADGYLVNATVFLDKNGNYQFDANEPSAVTDANGFYTLTVDATDVGKYPVVALAIKGITIDKDTNQAVANSFILSMPKDSVSGTVSNFISPLTSQLRELMETGMYTSMQQATDTLRTKMGLPAGTDVMSDYMATNNTAMHTAAQNMASLMGSQMSHVISANGATTAVDVNRYRGMMGTIFSNMSSVKVPNAPMANIMNTMTTALSNMPASTTGAPFKNMSTSFRGMMGGIKTISGGMK